MGIRRALAPCEWEYVRQIVRYGLSGLALTGLMSALYFMAISVLHLLPAVAVTLATILASIVGYSVHSRFSFRGFGARDNTARRFTLFLITNGVGYLLNLAFVIVLIDVMHLPDWTPTIAFCTITPIVPFLMNRHWVFG